jgi:hypothetical protein
VEGTFLEVIRADGRLDRHAIQSDRVTVGSAEEANIHIDGAAELEPLHLLLSPRDDGCWVSAARDARVTARRNGRLFENGVIPWGGELDVGAVMFRLARAEVHDTRRRKWRKDTRKIILLMLATWLGLQILGQRRAGPPRTNAEPPVLFDDLQFECGGHQHEAAERGREELDAAEARAERYPFAPHDGVESVRGFARAASCFRMAGKREMAKAVDKETMRMRARVDGDYQFHYLRLERALDHRRYREALREARLLQSYVRSYGGEYAEWLIRVDRALERRIGEDDDK